MSRLVEAMVQEGLVRRERDPEDARSVTLQATPKGRRILERGRGRRLDLLEALLAGASDAELEAIIAAAAAVERALQSA